MNIGKSLSGKFLLVWVASILATLSIAGAVFLYLLSDYHHKSAERELHASFNLIEESLILRDTRLDKIAQAISADRDVVSIVNLLNKYQDKQDYSAKTLDTEKRKLVELLARQEAATEQSFVAVYTKQHDLVAFTRRVQGSPYVSGYESYKNGSPVYLVSENNGNYVQIQELPTLAAAPFPSESVLGFEHNYQIISGGFAHVDKSPVFRKRIDGSQEVIGTVISINIIDDHYTTQTSQLIGHDFALRIPEREVEGNFASNLEFDADMLPVLFNDTEKPQTFFNDASFINPGETHFVGAKKLLTKDGKQVSFIVGVNRSAFISGISTLQISFLWTLAFVAVLMLPLGALYIRKNLTGPIALLMGGVTALSGKGEKTDITLVSQDELGTLARAFNDMAHTIKFREDDLKSGRDQLRMITDNLPVLIVYTDIEQRYRFVNRVCTQWFARPAEEIIGKRNSDIHKKEYAKFEPYNKQVYDGKEVSFTQKVTYPDGVTRDVRATFIPHFDEDGRVIGSFSFAEDITEFKRAEDQLRQSQKMEAVGQLTGGIAHDFNNILHVLSSTLELVKIEKGAKSKLDSRLDSMLRVVDRGANLTKQLLTFSRQQTLEPEILSANTVINDTLKILQRTIREDIEIKINLEENIQSINVDASMLGSSILNLALNARDAMNDGGVLSIETFAVDLDEAAIDASSEPVSGAFTVIRITDTGQGIEKNIIEKVFDPFFTTKDVGKGTGLGLSMVYGFVSQSDGHISIESDVGVGTVVELYFPAMAEGNKKIDNSNMVSGASVGHNGEGTILLVEDDEHVRMTTEEILKSLGYKVLVAEDGQSALKLLKLNESGGPEIKLLFSDVIMPGGISGIELATTVRSNYPDMQILLVTGYPERDFMQRGKDNQQQHDFKFLLKPYSHAKLSVALNNLFDG